jgi:hypothetical protein
MIKNNISSKYRNFRVTAPELVHFPDFAYAGSALAYADRTRQGLVFDGFSAVGPACGDHGPGASL